MLQKPTQKPVGFWKSPGVKVLGGGLLLAAGIGVKVFGLATIIGAPVLLPVGIGIAIAGAALAIWGIVQACQSEPAPVVPKIPPKPREPIYKGRNVCNLEHQLLLQLVGDLAHPDASMALSAIETLKELGLSDKVVNELYAVLKEYLKNKDKQLGTKFDELFLNARNHIRDFNSGNEVAGKAVEHRLKGRPYLQVPASSDALADSNWALLPAIAMATEQNDAHDSGTLHHHGHHGADPGGFDFGLS